jgi:hypothetical protein
VGGVVQVSSQSFPAKDTPKVWMDGYLAAFAIAGDLRMVTFDRVSEATHRAASSEIY